MRGRVLAYGIVGTQVVMSRLRSGGRSAKRLTYPKFPYMPHATSQGRLPRSSVFLWCPANCACCPQANLHVCIDRTCCSCSCMHIHIVVNCFKCSFVNCLIDTVVVTATFTCHTPINNNIISPCMQRSTRRLYIDYYRASASFSAFALISSYPWLQTCF
jgi:hypothetical protein